MKNKEHIISTIIANRSNLRLFGIKQLGLFGSYAKNTSTIESDIDLLVQFETGKKTLDNLLGAHALLESLFGKKTELITHESLSDNFREMIKVDLVYVSI